MSDDDGIPVRPVFVALTPDPRDQAEIASLRARAEKAEREVERLREVILRAGLWKKAPCCLCGYNGPGYFQPPTHPCAALKGDYDE